MDLLSSITIDPGCVLVDGDVAFHGASPYIAFEGLSEWRGGKILCALPQYTYWFLEGWTRRRPRLYVPGARHEQIVAIQFQHLWTAATSSARLMAARPSIARR